jgi:hypothetical protein
MDASEREVGWVVTSQVLPCDDVLDVVRCLSVLLVMEAIFTTVSGALAHELAGRVIHQFPHGRADNGAPSA